MILKDLKGIIRGSIFGIKFGFVCVEIGINFYELVNEIIIFLFIDKWCLLKIND